MLDKSEDKDEAYQIYQPLDNDGDHVHHATHTNDSDIIHNNTGDIHFGVPGNTWNNDNNPNQSAACGNGGRITNKVKSGDGDIAVMDRQLM